MEISPPRLDDRLVTLQPQPTTRGAPAPAGPPLSGRISVGGPIAVAVTGDYVAGSPDLAAFVRQEEATSTYHLVHLAISFDAAEEEPTLSTASVGLRLSSPAEAATPIAWSMLPSRVTDPTEVVTSFTLGPQLKLLGADLSPGSMSRSSTRRDTEVFLEALRELRSDPGWHLQRTSNLDLRGSHRLVMVVRADRAAPVRVDVAVRATATQGGLFRRYRAEVEGTVTASTVV
jgi:hypothetical protein